MHRLPTGYSLVPMAWELHGGMNLAYRHGSCMQVRELHVGTNLAWRPPAAGRTDERVRARVRAAPWAWSAMAELPRVVTVARRGGPTRYPGITHHARRARGRLCPHG